MSARPLFAHCQYATPPILFDPDGDVLTTDHLDAFVEERKPMLNNYVRHVRIGKGQHGDVYLCQKINSRLPYDHPERRIPVAMKSVKRNNPRAEQLKKLKKNRLPSSSHIPVADKLNTTEAKIKREIAIMKKLRHPHVVRLYEVIDDRIQEKIYMVMEYLGGGEVKWRDDHNNPVLTVSQTRRILRDAVLGLEYLHLQGIIHRDIKPANLLWTEDRRQVKIGDFGVSHFSYAQRLAGAGGKDGDDPSDPILLDESGLTRRAGTPSFLAPEVIYEHTRDVPGSISLNGSALQSSSSLSSSPGSLSGGHERPQITKAIDVWALGVTLYCLLFGTTPFVAQPSSETTGGSEFSLYVSICNDDWPAPPTMGFDIVPSGGRHPKIDSEGASIIHLLDHFLQKDANLRITLDEVKSSIRGSKQNPWLLKDLADPRKWLEMTAPKTAKINVSVNETTDAMSVVHFRWRWGRIAHHVSSLFRRPPRVPQNASRPQNGQIEVASDPQGQGSNYSAQRPAAAVTTPRRTLSTKRDKGKQKAEPPKDLKRPPSKGSKSLRSKSIERWSEKDRGGNSTSTSALQQHNPQRPSVSIKPRRGSDSKTLDRVAAPTAASSPTGSKPETILRSQPTTNARGQRRTRFALFSKKNLSSIIDWRPKYDPAAHSATAAPTAEIMAPEETQSIAEIMQSPNLGEGEEIPNHQAFNPEDPGGLTAARRASSWGQGDTDLAEIVNIPSIGSIGYKLNEQEMNVGAGGVTNNGITVPAVLPGPSTPRNEYLAAYPTVPQSQKSQIEINEEDELRRYGKPVYDDDSSTIASLVDHEDDGASWHRGSELDVDVDYDPLEDFEQDSSDDEEDRGVMFSPRRHAHNDGERNRH